MRKFWFEVGSGYLCMDMYEPVEFRSTLFKPGASILKCCEGCLNHRHIYLVKVNGRMTLVLQTWSITLEFFFFWLCREFRNWPLLAANYYLPDLYLHVQLSCHLKCHVNQKPTCAIWCEHQFSWYNSPLIF